MNYICTNFKQTNMKALIIFCLLVGSLSVQSQVKCKGVKANGEPCRSVMVSKATGYCNAHNPSAKHCTFVKKDGTRCKMTTKGELCRFHVQG